MEKKELKELNNELIDTFRFAGDKAINLRNQGLKTEVKKDNTPVTNGDLEVNEILTKQSFNVLVNRSN